MKVQVEAYGRRIARTHACRMYRSSLPKLPGQPFRWSSRRSSILKRQGRGRCPSRRERAKATHSGDYALGTGAWLNENA
jgi:hypothetical protein